MVNMKMLYDACRKYKYFYKRYEAVKGLKDEYGYDKDVRCLAEKFEDELSDAYDELCSILLSPFCDKVSINVDYPDTYYDWYGGYYSARSNNVTTSIDGREFADLMRNVISRNYEFVEVF